MATFQKTIGNGFNAKWELDSTEIARNGTFVTKIQTVDGMPDVKWHLKWNYNDRNYILSLIYESQNEIEYSINVYYFLDPDDAKYQKTGKSNGHNSVELEVLHSSDLDGNTINGKLHISVGGSFTYTKSPLDALAEWGLRLKESFPTDFDIIVDNQIIPIHKQFLAAESPVFAKMFDSNFKETKENKVTISETSYETVTSAIGYCYRQDISSSLEDQNKSIDLLYFCDKYDFQTLKPIVESHLIKKLSKENISILVLTSGKTNALELRQSCINYICDLRNKNEGLSADIISTFEKQFLADIVFHCLN